MSARFLMSVCFAVVFSALPADAVAESDVTITPDIVYGHKDGLALTLDKYVPDEKTNGAAVVFMVSGGWVSKWAPPEQLQGLFNPYLENGFTVFSVRHGSSPRYGIPDAVSDVRRSIRFIRLHAEDYGIDADRIGVLGMSAGGHLSLVLATTGDDGDANATDPVLQTSSRVATVAAVVPPTDLRVAVWEAEESLPAYRNFPALNLPLDEAAEYSPVVHVTPDDASALVISGTKDELVPSKHGQWIADAFTKQNVTVKLILLEANHGLMGKQTEAFAAIANWFNEQLSDQATIATNVDRQPFPNSFGWGSIVATETSVDLHVTAVPEDRIIRIPRFNNPYKRIFVRNEPDAPDLKFKPEVDEWLITLPESVSEGSVIAIETVGKPQLVTEPVVIKVGKQSVCKLPAHHAVTHGELLRYEPQPHKNTVGYWANEKDWCEWLVDFDKAATYEVEVLQGCGKGHGGSEVTVSVGNSEVSFVVEDTGHFQNFKPRKIGTIHIDQAGLESLKVVPISKAKGAVMDVRQIRLIPVK